MKTISDIFSKFLKYKKNDVKKATYDKYDFIIFLFEDSLNNYSHIYLDEDEQAIFERKYDQENKEFCEIFGIDKISNTDIEQFMEYFLIRKVIGDKETIKYSGTVLRQLLKWLKNNSYIDNNYYDEFISIVNRLKGELSNALDVADILSEKVMDGKMNSDIFHFGMDNGNRDAEYEETKEAIFSITEIKKGKLWLIDYSDPSEIFGPVIVPEEVSAMAKEGWKLYLVIGKKNNKWHILESGNVYPGYQ